MKFASSTEHAAVFDHFGVVAQDRPAASCYPYAPVFHTVVEGTDAALKRTRKPAVAAAIGCWLGHLRGVGIQAVLPLSLGVENPAVVGEDTWVAYPWVAGRPYDASGEDVAAAGEMLGRLHAASADHPAGLPPFTWPEFDQASIDQDVEDLSRVLRAQAADVADGVLARMVPALQTFADDTLPVIRDAELPWVVGTVDFRATNLVWGPDGPVLVDPDNAEYAPRVLDLALAALLFHHECDTAPARMLSPAEWKVFVAGYTRHVSLTPTEREVWPAALRYMFLEWITWSLIDSGEWENWRRPRSGAQLRDLATTELDALRWPLPD